MATTTMLLTIPASSTAVPFKIAAPAVASHAVMAGKGALLTKSALVDVAATAVKLVAAKKTAAACTTAAIASGKGPACCAALAKSVMVAKGLGVAALASSVPLWIIGGGLAFYTIYGSYTESSPGNETDDETEYLGTDPCIKHFVTKNQTL